MRHDLEAGQAVAPVLFEDFPGRNYLSGTCRDNLKLKNLESLSPKGPPVENERIVINRVCSPRVESWHVRRFRFQVTGLVQWSSFCNRLWVGLLLASRLGVPRALGPPRSSRVLTKYLGLNVFFVLDVYICDQLFDRW
jgi:hypothetical protein